MRRQLATLLGAGNHISVIDTDARAQRVDRLNYTIIRISPIDLGLPARLIWVLLQRLRPASGEAFWTLVHALQVLLTGLQYGIAAYRTRANFYQAHDLYSLLPALVAGRLRHRKVVYDAHELASDQGDPRSLRNAFDRALERVLIPRADELIVPSAGRARVYVERHHPRAQPTIVMNCPPTSTVGRTNRLRERLALPPSTRVVLYHGSFVAHRALEQLMLAARKFDPHTVLVMLGDQNSYFREVLQPLHATEHLQDHVVFMPYTEPDQLPPYVASADLGVVITRLVNLNNYLPAPTKLYEFLMLGVPVVVVRVPEMEMLLEEYPVGLMFDPEDPSSIASAINACLRANADERRRRAEALARARRAFTWEREGEKLLSIFTSTPSGRRTGARTSDASPVEWSAHSW